jgi:uncharacterized surface protein with fasciclin (FAS1) repeats
MSDNKTLTAILAIISIFLLGAVAFGLTQIDGINNKSLVNNSLSQVTDSNKSISVKSNNTQSSVESISTNPQSVTASRDVEVPKKEVSAIKEAVKSEAKLSNILDTANSNSDISIFVSAVKAAGLEEALRGEGQLTIFAPNNEAFTKYLPTEKLTELQKPENKEELSGILKGHFVGVKLLSSDLKDGQYIPTQQGGQLLVKVNEDQYYVDDIFITKPNMEATNGIIHTINRIIPE